MGAVTPECAVEVSGWDSRWLGGCSVPGYDHKPAGNGHCSADNRTPAFLQTQAPPKKKSGGHMLTIFSSKRTVIKIYFKPKTCELNAPVITCICDVNSLHCSVTFFL